MELFLEEQYRQTLLCELKHCVGTHHENVCEGLQRSRDQLTLELLHTGNKGMKSWLES